MRNEFEFWPFTPLSPLPWYVLSVSIWARKCSDLYFDLLLMGSTIKYTILFISGLLHPICYEPMFQGGCQASLKRFYHDKETGTCKQFYFGGCNGNSNNFKTMEECNDFCSGNENMEVIRFSLEINDYRNDLPDISHLKLCRWPTLCIHLINNTLN